jgi:flavin reductase (DIM6/NTAB) family NADH-FMN oxidoreductase RutF
MKWLEPDMFDSLESGNKPFGIRIPSLLVTRNRDNRLNFMTAMWFTPVGFEPSRMIVAVERKSHTYGVLCETGEFVMSAPSRGMMDIVVMAGRVSGRNVDKWEASGLTAVRPSRTSVPLIGEAIGNVEYRVINRMELDDRTDLFVGEALCAYIRKGAMEGDLYREGSDPLLYMGTKYDENGKSMGKFSASFSGISAADYESPLLKKYVTRK